MVALVRRVQSRKACVIQTSLALVLVTYLVNFLIFVILKVWKRFRGLGSRVLILQCDCHWLEDFRMTQGGERMKEKKKKV